MANIYTPALLYMDGSFRENMVVVTDGGVIQSVGLVEEMRHQRASDQHIEWSHLAMLPGTVNTHCHAFQSLLRGFVADAPFLDWRDRSLYRYAPYLDAEAIYLGSRLAFAEMLRNGVTTVAEFFYVHDHGTENDEAVIRAAQDTGIRLMFARAMYDWPGAPEAYRETVEEAVARTRALSIKYQGNAMVSICPAPHSLHAASPEMVRAGHRLAQELDTRFHIHVAEECFEVEQVERERGCRPVEFLDRLDVVDPSMVAVHLVWLAPSEIALLGERRAKLAYCPSSNMFLADGVTDLPALLDAGVTAGLGTDGPCSNNRVSVFEEMRMASLLQKVRRLDATVIPAEMSFAMGTRHGGEVLGMPVGAIEPGGAADFVGIDLRDLSLQPAPLPLSALTANVVYAMQPNAIARVVVADREIVRDGQLQTVPNDRIACDVERLVAGWPRPE